MKGARVMVWTHIRRGFAWDGVEPAYYCDKCGLVFALNRFNARTDDYKAIYITCRCGLQAEWKHERSLMSHHCCGWCNAFTSQLGLPLDATTEQRMNGLCWKGDTEVSVIADNAPCEDWEKIELDGPHDFTKTWKYHNKVTKAWQHTHGRRADACILLYMVLEEVYTFLPANRDGFHSL